MKDGQIKRLDVAGCPVTVWTQLLLHKNKWRSPAINVFIEFIKKYAEIELEEYWKFYST